MAQHDFRLQKVLELRQRLRDKHRASLAQASLAREQAATDLDHAVGGEGRLQEALRDVLCSPSSTGLGLAALASNLEAQVGLIVARRTSLDQHERGEADRRRELRDATASFRAMEKLRERHDERGIAAAKRAVLRVDEELAANRAAPPRP